MNDHSYIARPKQLLEVKAIAHVKQTEHGMWMIHDLEEHLRGVAKLAREMASSFGSQDCAELAGLWHDLGKYRPAFQRYIRKASGYDPEAHIEQGQGRVDHSTAGAIYAANELKEHGLILAYLIAGHHAGLPDWSTADGDGGAALSMRLEQGKISGLLDQALANSIPSEILDKKIITSKSIGGVDGLHLWMRMLFSCLVDADFLDTEAFMSPDKKAKRSLWPSLSELKFKFDHYMQEKTVSAEDTRVNKIRSQILQNCRDAAKLDSGIFSLTVPTGGGKTLSGMAFAIEHAILHKKQRIIIVIPYTSIIEQTVDQYREIFGNAVIEHHSNLDPEKETPESRLAAENWDAPIIVTTNVQLLESLFSARTSSCRKLHNLVNSIIVFDEAQLLPPEFLQPILDVLRMLTQYYGVTLVLSTATQPALGTVKDPFGKISLRGLDPIKEIIPNVKEIYAQLDRVNVEKPVNMEKRVIWEELSQELLQYPSVLVIVNTRKDCQTLFELMPKETIHLSGRMCGQHRTKVIKHIKLKLKAGEPVRVISTQLVEAGVDLDFPVVYRALAGLDSIAQAAGRCNREGKLASGKVVVFVPPKSAPQGMLLFGEQATKNVWHNHAGHPLSHELYDLYFQLYFGSEKPDKHDIMPLLTQNARSLQVQFRTAAAKFKLIDDSGTYQILVPYGEEGQSLISLLEATGSERNSLRYLLRKLQRYNVTVYENEFNQLKNIGAIRETKLGIFVICITNAYDETRGLLLVDELYFSKPASLVF